MYVRKLLKDNLKVMEIMTGLIWNGQQGSVSRYEKNRWIMKLKENTTRHSLNNIMF